MSRFDSFDSLGGKFTVPSKWIEKKQYVEFVSFVCECELKITISVEKGKTRTINSVSCPVCGRNIISSFTVQSLET